jgi:hypothetical protein
MSLSMSKCWYSNNCLHFSKRAGPLVYFNMMSMVPCKYLISMSSISTYSAFADDEEGVAVGPLPDDVVALFVERLEVYNSVRLASLGYLGSKS